MLGGIDNQLFLTSFGGFFALIFLMLMLKWAFARGKSVVERPSRIGDENEYGMLESVAEPLNHIEGQMLKEKLKNSGIKANLVQTTSGPRLMVFKDQVAIARSIIENPQL
ncbi:MAG: hypothetical protein ACO3RC_02755 [Candidatus Nanopelagicaceae bacterium]